MRKLAKLTLLVSALLLTSASLTGCMTAPPVPEKLVISVPNATANPHAMRKVNQQIRDQRLHNHILRVEYHDDHAEFATSHVPLATLISEAMKTYWPHQASANQQVTLFLDEALIRVYPNGNQYQGEHRFAMRVLVSTDSEWIAREYSTSVAAGPYKVPDYEHLTRTFNQIIENTLQEVANDSILGEWLEAHGR